MWVIVGNKKNSITQSFFDEFIVLIMAKLIIFLKMMFDKKQDILIVCTCIVTLDGILLYATVEENDEDE